MYNQFSFQIVFQENGSHEIEINDIYKIDPRDDTIQTVPYGRWDPEKGILSYQPNIWDRHSDFKGRKLR